MGKVSKSTKKFAQKHLKSTLHKRKRQHYKNKQLGSAAGTTIMNYITFGSTPSTSATDVAAVESITVSPRPSFSN
jgi:hypothetical protein